MYEYPNGVKAKFTCLTSNAKDGYQIKVKGDKGTIIMGTRNAWFYPEGTKNKKIGTVDGVAGATASFEKNKGYPIKVDHQDPSKQALQDFRDSIILNNSPISNITTGANTAIAVQMGLQAMYTNSIIMWPSKINF